VTIHKECVGEKRVCCVAAGCRHRHHLGHATRESDSFCMRRHHHPVWATLYMYEPPTAVRREALLPSIQALHHGFLTNLTMVNFHDPTVLLAELRE